MHITVKEFEKEVDKYLLLSETEDVFITRNGKVVSLLTNPYKDRVELVESLVGIIPEEGK